MGVLHRTNSKMKFIPLTSHNIIIHEHDLHSIRIELLTIINMIVDCSDYIDIQTDQNESIEKI